MHADLRTTPGKRVPMDAMRKTALIAGGLYLLTFITSIPALALKGPALHRVDFILGAGSQTGVIWAGFLDVACALAGIGTALALYQVARRYSETAAVGFIASRVVEATIIVGGVISLLSIVTLRQHVAGAAGTDAATLVTTGRSLVAIHNWTFLLGPGVMSGVNGLFLGYVMYKSRLVPRIIPIVGLIGPPSSSGRRRQRCLAPSARPRPGASSPDSPSPSGSSRSAPGWSSRASSRRPPLTN